MRSTLPQSALWRVVLDQVHIDPADLAAAIEQELGRGELDFRTRLLIRDSVAALERVWRKNRLEQWLAGLDDREAVDRICGGDLGKPGFPSLGERVMETTRKETVLQFLRELGSRLDRPAQIAIGGSVALILCADLSRRTEDIDVVDEVPAPIRDEHELLAELSRRYGLHMTHFQSHYLPAGWESRIKRFGRFGSVDVAIVDEWDVWLSKLFSGRVKDRDDLRMLAPRMDKPSLVDRLQRTCGGLLAEASLRRHAEENWYIVFGEALPA
jgi:hypothetical protein